MILVIKSKGSFAIFVGGYSENCRLVPFRASAFEEVQKKPAGFF